MTRRATDPALIPPWTDDLIHRLNALQTGTLSGGAMLPYICPSRDDGRHGGEGGDTGVLIATVDGWVCPHCDYVQHSVAPPSEIQPVAMVGPSGIQSLVPSIEEQRARIQARIDAYHGLAERGAKGAACMVRSLQARLEQILRPPAPMSMWVVYERPMDFPDDFVARRFVITNGMERPTNEVLRASSLDALRDLAPAGVGCIPRQVGDDPNIVECWL